MISRRAVIEGGRVRFDMPYRDRETIKMIPGTKFLTSEELNEDRWFAPLTWATVKISSFLFRDNPIEFSDELYAWADNYYNTVVKNALALRTALDITTEGAPTDSFTRLWEHQRAEVAFAVQSPQSLLAAGMGAGKSITSTVWLEVMERLHGNALPALIVTPNGVKRQFEKEIHKWVPDFSTSVVHGPKLKRTKAIQAEADITIINWEAVRSHSRLAPYGSVRLSEKDRIPKELNEIEWASVVADEVHRAQNPKSQQTRALWAVGHQDSVNYRLGMSGTPVADHPATLWAILHFLDPLTWPSKVKFIDLFCVRHVNYWGGEEIIGLREDMKELFYSLLDPMFRRDPRDVFAKYLPPEPVFTTRYVTMTPKQKKAYDSMEKDLLAELDGEVFTVYNPAVKHTRLSQFAAAYAELVVIKCPKCKGTGSLEEEECKKCAGVGEIDNIKLAEPSCKVDQLMQDVEDRDGEPFVAFAESTQLLKLCAKRLEKQGVEYTPVYGGVSEAVRERGIERFQAGEIPVLLAQYQAGGEGLNLQRADMVVILQWSDSAILNAQAISRADRPGQENRVHVVEYRTEDTIEDDRWFNLEEKDGRQQEVLRDKEVFAEMLRAKRGKK